MRYYAFGFTAVLSIVLATLLALTAPTVVCAKETKIDFTNWQKWRVPVDPKRVAEIAAMLPDKPQGTGSTIEDRAFWDRCAKQPHASRPIKKAEGYLGKPLPEFSEKLFLDYFEGSKRREPYNKEYWYPVTSPFSTLTVAECLENQGRFLPELERYLTVFCDMPSWTWPWHDRYHDTLKIKNAQIALETSALANHLATTKFWLGDRLSPKMQTRISAELERRIFQLFEESIRNKKREREWWITGTNNWNPVCLNGVVRAALTEIESKERRAFYIAAAEQSVRNFFKGFSPNGYCDEGVGYWSYGVGNYAQLAEAVYQATDGKLDWFHHSPAADILGTPTVAEVARYPERIQITPKISPPFADCPITAQGDIYTLTLLRRRLNLPGVFLTAAEVEKPNVAAGTIGHYQRISIHATLEKTLPKKAGKASVTKASFTRSKNAKARFTPQRSYYDEHGVYVGRPGESSKARLSVALLGGHNAESHNHNDVGTYVLVCDDKTPLIDPGAEVYTRRTFSPQRYESDVLNSFGHPVPKVAGQLQRGGRNARGKIRSTRFSDKEDRIEMDMTSAYAVKTLESLVREYVYSRESEGKLTITDTVAFSKPEAFESALITLTPWEQLDKNRLRIGKGKGAVDVTFTCDACPVEVKLTKIHEELRGKINEVTRLGLVLTKPVKNATLKVEIEPSKL